MTQLDELKTPELSEKEESIQSYHEEIKNFKAELSNHEEVVNNKVEPLTEAEKKEYEELNKKFSDIRKKLAFQYNKFEDYGVQNKVRDLLKSNKSSQVGAWEYENEIWIFSYNTEKNNYDEYHFLPYRKSESPYLITVDINSMTENPESKTILTVKQYETMITKVETLYKVQEETFSKIIKKQEIDVDNMINNP